VHPGLLQALPVPPQAHLGPSQAPLPPLWELPAALQPPPPPSSEEEEHPYQQPPPPPSLTVRLGQNCDNHSGWQKEIGVGDWSAGSGFPGDASYITVPAGLTAKLTNAGGTDQVVKGPGEFNFCSRRGFNDK
jgi:hypothetical protein